MNSNTLVAPKNEDTITRHISRNRTEAHRHVEATNANTKIIKNTLPYIGYFESVRRAISRANPDKCKRELDLLFVEYHYGKELAERVKKHIEMKDAGWK